MAFSSSSDLLNWLDRRQFLKTEQTFSLRPEVDRFAGIHGLAKELIARNWLTPFQANQILQGKGDSLILGDYRLLERIGEGAMGQVYKAWNLRLDRVVAVKTIHRQKLDNIKAMERFKKEMHTAGMLDHPNIVLVRDADEVDRQPFMVMEYVVGIDIAKMVKKNGPLAVHVAAEFTRQAALGLQHAFERGVVHRDIKPGNLLWTNEPGSGTSSHERVDVLRSLGLVKITDFGLARFEGDSDQGTRLTQLGTTLGTIDYISPEQAENARTADIRSDIYSLGCSLFFMLAGRPPFTGGDLVEKISVRLINEAPNIRQLRPEVPPAMAAVLGNMLARHPEKRYQTPLEVAAALEPFTGTATAQAPLLAPPVQADAVTPMPGAPSTDTEASAPFANDNPFAFSAMDIVPPVVPNRVSAKSGERKHVNATAPRNRWLYALGAGVVLVLTLIIAILLGRSLSGARAPAVKKTSAADAAVQVMPPPPLLFDLGGTKTFVVKIQRQNFSGPVRVEFRDLPEYFSAQAITIAEDLSQKEMKLTVSYPPQSLKAELRLFAVAENLRDECFLSVEVKGPDQSKKKGKS